MAEFVFGNEPVNKSYYNQVTNYAKTMEDAGSICPQDGIVTKAEFYCRNTTTNLCVGLGYATTGTKRKNRSYANLGDFGTTGAKTVLGLVLECKAGDFIAHGAYAVASIVYAISGGSIRYGSFSDYYDGNEVNFSSEGSQLYSICLTGETAAAGQPFIKRFGGVPFVALNRGVF